MHMTFSEARKMPIQEFHLDKVWSGLELIKEQVNFTQCLQTGPSSTRGNFSWNPKSQLRFVLFMMRRQL
ncbi:Hypothetical predicted protein, partial [Cloeon dipterum]